MTEEPYEPPFEYVYPYVLKKVKPLRKLGWLEFSILVFAHKPRTFEELVRIVYDVPARVKITNAQYSVMSRALRDLLGNGLLEEIQKRTYKLVHQGAWELDQKRKKRRLLSK